MRKFITSVLAAIVLSVPFISSSLPATAVDCYTVTVRQGSTGECVNLAQTRLNYYNCNAGPVDGYFGSMTANAARAFQTKNGLYVDGVVGPQTWGKLKTDTATACNSTTVDNDATDRALCTNSNSKCILVHQVGGVNRLEIYENKVLIESVTVNTGMSGVRTRNTTTHSIYDETFATEASETVTNAGYGVDPKKWAPGVRQVLDARAQGLLGDPHKFSGGQAFHWRVQSSSQLDENGKSIPVLVNGLAQESTYDGGYRSGGCVHTPKWFIDKYDASFFQTGVRVRVQDQPAS